MKPTLLIFLKEAREMLRDKRVVNAAFVAPVFMIILFVLVFGLIETKVSRKPDLRLAFVRDGSNPMTQALEKSGEVQLKFVDSVEDGLALLDEGEVRAVVEFGPDFANALARGHATVTAHYESTEPLSSIAMAAVRKIVEEMNKESARALLAQNGIGREMAEPIEFVQKDIQKTEGLGGSMIVALVPYLIVLWAFYGGFSTVTDLVAGEKERGTMETLLVSPVTRRQVALGKFLALGAICLVSSLTTLVGVMAVGLIQLDLTKALFPTGLQISFLAVLGMFGILVPLVVLFASLLIAVSAYAKNAREAQTYLTLVSFVVLMPAIFSQFIGFTGAQEAMWVRLTPILNSAVALKEALLDDLALNNFLMAAGVNLVLGAAMLKIAFWLFHREQILTRV